MNLRLNQRPRRWSPTFCERMCWRLFLEMTRVGVGGVKLYKGLRLDIPADGGPCFLWLDGFGEHPWIEAIFIERARVVFGRIGALWTEPTLWAEPKPRHRRVKLRREAL